MSCLSAARSIGGCGINSALYACSAIRPGPRLPPARTRGLGNEHTGPCAPIRAASETSSVHIAADFRATGRAYCAAAGGFFRCRRVDYDAARRGAGGPTAMAGMGQSDGFAALVAVRQDRDTGHEPAWFRGRAHGSTAGYR